MKDRSDWYIIIKCFEDEFGEDLIKTVAHTGGPFLDIGSAQGLYSLIAARAGAETVYAVDPDPISSRKITGESSSQS